jgi:LigXa C-terminal domain like
MGDTTERRAVMYYEGYRPVVRVFFHSLGNAECGVLDSLPICLHVRLPVLASIVGERKTAVKQFVIGDLHRTERGGPPSSIDQPGDARTASGFDTSQKLIESNRMRPMPGNLVLIVVDDRLVDDTHVMSFRFNWKHKTPVLSRDKTGEPLPLLARATETLPNTTDWFGRWRPVANPDNDYLIDREAQRTISYTGIAGVFPQDSAVTVSMGEISDRTLEHLAPSDRMIVMTRRRLIDAARALRDHGTVPPLVDDPDISYAIRSGDLIAPEAQPWLEAYEQTLQRARHPALLQAAE